MGSNEDIIHDAQGNNVVVIDTIRFKGRQHINWEDIENYLKLYVGCHYEIIETSEKVYIGSDFPKELKGAVDTKALKGTNAKAKANATQKLPLLCGNDEKVIRFNIFRIEMLIRHASDGKRYLYDLVNVKKEKETKYPT